HRMAKAPAKLTHKNFGVAWTSSPLDLSPLPIKKSAPQIGRTLFCFCRCRAQAARQKCCYISERAARPPLDFLASARRGRRCIGWQSAHLGDQLGISVQISQHDHLTNFSIFITATSNASKCTKETASTAAKAQVALAAIAFGQSFFFGGAGID